MFMIKLFKIVICAESRRRLNFLTFIALCTYYILYAKPVSSWFLIFLLFLLNV